MRKDRPIQTLQLSDEERKRMKRFWVMSFCIYAGVDALLITLNYVVTKSMCRPCALPPVFYVIQWICSLLFTAGLWYCMNLLYSRNHWINTVVNIVLFFAHFFLWILVLYGVMHSGQKWLIGKDTYVAPWWEFVYGSWYDIGKYVLKATAFYVLKSYVEYRRTERQRIELAVLNKDMQLNLLKQQLSPHFYFNTLNNLYGLARSNSPKLQDALHQLSNIMQYVIVDCNKPKVLLSQEVNFLQSYIALEKLRYEQNTVIDMQVTGYVNGQSILPLLLIQFVENAFKHGMKEKSEHNWMKVNLAINKDNLLFSVDNSYYTSEHSEGIGINSVKHRLNLQYEGKYDMKMQHEGHRFSVTLKLDLS